MNQLYYRIKPLTPWAIRIAMRRIRANRLRRQVNGSWPILESSAKAPSGWPGWPDGKQFAFVLTHDVEGVRGFDRSKQLAELDKTMGFRSTFNFVPEGEYRLSDDLRLFLTQEGFEIGVHDFHHDGSLYRSFEGFKAQAQKINDYLKSWGAQGFRSGFMFHNLEWIHEINASYDASTFDTDPFEPQPDGVGSIFPFWVQRNGTQGYVELPYTLAQDFTLFILLKEQTIDLWVNKLDWVASHGGMALVDVHPDYVNFDGKTGAAEYPVALYEELLQYVSSRYRETCWFALPREVAEYTARYKPVLLR